jgi:hypothetical protein
MSRLIAALFVVWLLTSCASHPQITRAADTEFVKILSNPAAFDGETVKVRGWISVRHEDKNFWLTWKDHENWEVSRCISLVHYDLLDDVAKSLDGRYVEITGTFRMDASNNGSMIRLASCSKRGIELENAASVVRILD